MSYTADDRLQQIDLIAEQDEIYQIWLKSREQFADSFQAFANIQDEQTRNMLWGFACAGEMAIQRKLLLACQTMVFPEEI